ncbi:Transglutaminase-like superfamily protein [Ruminococcaceae bacterium FB2012]|nr:Transglutaminase-like superfamily protein [Ruminococcaceae bacterium FB2012]
MKQKKTKNTERGIINPNGIIIEGDIALSMKYETGKDRMLLMRTLLCILTATFTMIILGSFIGASSLTAFPVILTSISFAALSSKNGIAKIYGIGYLLFQVTYFLIMFNEVVTGIEIALLKYQKRADFKIFESIESDIAKQHIGPESAEYYLFHAMMFVAAIVTVAVALACIVRTDFPIFFISTFPFLEIGLFFGWDPPYVAAVGLVVCWITMLSFSILNHSTNKAGMNNTFAVHRRKEAFFFTSKKFKNRFFSHYLSVVAFVCAAVFAVSIIFSAVTGFVRPKVFDELRSTITEFANNIPDKFDEMIDSLFNRAKEVGVTNGGKLGNKDEISFNDNVVLDIQLSKIPKSTLYLKGYIAGKYEDNEWDQIKPDKKDTEKLEKTFGNRPIQNYNYYAFPIRDIEVPKSTISLYNDKADNRFIYAPYMADYLSQNMNDRAKAEGEGSVKQLSKSYMIDFLDVSDISDSWDKQFGIIDTLSLYRDSGDPLSKAYSDFVNKYYTDVTSSEGLETVYNQISSQLMQNYPQGLNNEYNRERIAASAITNYLDKNYRYTLQPGETGSGWDFIDYFLRENKVGYCTYFASAGTMLMRRFGFPARYVEGFIVTQKDFFIDEEEHIHAQITDRAAHAWCEVFIDSVGWVPLEFTPGYQGSNNPNDPNKVTTTTTKETTTTTTTVTTTAFASSTNASASSGSSASGSSATTAVSASTGGNGTGSGGSVTEPGPTLEYKDSKFISFLRASLVYIIILTVIIVIFFVRRKLLLKKQLKLTTQEDKAKAFIWVYIYYLRYLELINISDDSNISDEAQATRLMSKCHKNGIDSIIPSISYLSSTSIEIHLSQDRTVSYEEHGEALSALRSLKDEIVPERLSIIGKMAAKWLYGLY